MSVVEDQGARIPAKGLLVLRCLVRGFPWSSSDLNISRALVHIGVGCGDRCQANGGSGCGNGQ